MKARGRDESRGRDVQIRYVQTREMCRTETSRAETCRAETRPEEQSKAKTSAERRKQNRGAKTKTGRVPCNEREKSEPEFAGEARSFIGSAQHN